MDTKEVENPSYERVEFIFERIAESGRRMDMPVLVGECSADRVAAVIDLLWGGPETLIVISSDLSHFHSYEVAQRLDAHTSESIQTKSRNLTGEEACGAAAINGLMASHGAESLVVHTLDVRNSGDTAADKARVVGYGAYALA